MCPRQTHVQWHFCLVYMGPPPRDGAPPPRALQEGIPPFCGRGAGGGGAVGGDMAVVGAGPLWQVWV